YVFRERVIVRFLPSRLRRDATGRRWLISATNKTKNITSQSLVIYCQNETGRILSAHSLDRENSVHAELEVKSNRLVVSSDFWPRDRALKFTVLFDKRGAPVFECPGYP